MSYTVLTQIINNILTERGRAMCYAVHPGTMEQCALLDVHTGMHETEFGLVWGCEEGEHIFHAMEGQRWPATSCLICGIPYVSRIKTLRKPRAKRKS